MYVSDPEGFVNLLQEKGSIDRLWSPITSLFPRVAHQCFRYKVLIFNRVQCNVAASAPSIRALKISCLNTLSYLLASSLQQLVWLHYSLKILPLFSQEAGPQKRIKAVLTLLTILSIVACFVVTKNTFFGVVFHILFPVLLQPSLNVFVKTLSYSYIRVHFISPSLFSYKTRGPTDNSTWKKKKRSYRI